MPKKESLPKKEWKMVRIDRENWLKLRKSSVIYDFDVGVLLNWILDDLDQDAIDEHAKDCDHEFRVMIREDQSKEFEEQIESEFIGRSKKEVKEEPKIEKKEESS